MVRYLADGHMVSHSFHDLAAAQAFLRGRDGYITRRQATVEAA